MEWEEEMELEIHITALTLLVHKLIKDGDIKGALGVMLIVKDCYTIGAAKGYDLSAKELFEQTLKALEQIVSDIKS